MNKEKILTGFLHMVYSKTASAVLDMSLMRMTFYEPAKSEPFEEQEYDIVGDTCAYAPPEIGSKITFGYNNWIGQVGQCQSYIVKDVRIAYKRMWDKGRINHVCHVIVEKCKFDIIENIVSQSDSVSPSAPPDAEPESEPESWWQRMIERIKG